MGINLQFVLLKNIFNILFENNCGSKPILRFLLFNIVLGESFGKVLIKKLFPLCILA